MPTSLHKTRKIISKKRGGEVTALHAKSRDSKRLRMAHARDLRLEKLANVRSKKEEPIVDRIQYFQNHLKERDVFQLELSEVQTLIYNFVHQYDEEFNEVKKARRPGRAATAREDLLKRKIDALEEEYEKGFLIPDVFDEDQGKKLFGYEGSWAYIATISWSKVSKAGKISKGDIPSKGIL
ncbi:translation machinery-associated protein, putative [Cordyceps militaris CM01]|uniref:Translation machinery-associated protein, putative n=2 Tax=Cordyceps militaris TaxID=73501 RepID=G3JHZ9_CORMM|nr:translation machinery-associated protein, putative [Cordyceps militaris CM01]ATY58381.1 translation machinery-associated [Cordyceps militaris]EGX91802.1 translation machinery-associated protein, putative [Cordyceps militaris CM01]